MQRFKERRTDAETVRKLNRQKKEFECLGCGRVFVTDRCHRFCRVCKRRNAHGNNAEPRVAGLGLNYRKAMGHRPAYLELGG